MRKAYKYGLILTPEALDYILFSVEDVDSLFKDLFRRGIRVVRLEDITGETNVVDEKEEPVEKVVEKEESAENIIEVNTTQDCENRVRVVLYIDPDEIEPASWEREQERILRERLDYLGSELLNKHRIAPTDYDRAMRSDEERDVLGIVLKKEIRNGKTLIYLENETDTTRILVTRNENSWKLDYLDLDSVAALEVVGNGEILIAKDVLFPYISKVRRGSDCSYKLLVIPDAHKRKLGELPLKEADGIVFLSNLVNVYRATDVKAQYREIDNFVTSLEKDIFIVPGMYDVTRSVPPHPPIEENLMPNSAHSDHVHLLGSPALVRIGPLHLLFYDGEYYIHTGIPPETILYTRLVQPNISSYPFRASKDYSLLKKTPDMVLTPVGGKVSSVGDIRMIKFQEPYIVDIYSGKVIPV